MSQSQSQQVSNNTLGSDFNVQSFTPKEKPQQVQKQQSKKKQQTKFQPAMSALTNTMFSANQTVKENSTYNNQVFENVENNSISLPGLPSAAQGMLKTSPLFKQTKKVQVYPNNDTIEQTQKALVSTPVVQKQTQKVQQQVQKPATVESTFKKQAEQQKKLVDIIGELLNYVQKLEQEKQKSQTELKKVNNTVQNSTVQNVSSVLVEIKQVSKLIGKSNLTQVNNTNTVFDSMKSVIEYNNAFKAYKEKASLSPVDKLNEQLKLQKLKQEIYLEVIQEVQSKLSSIKSDLSQQIKQYGNVITNTNSKLSQFQSRLPQNVRNQLNKIQ